MADPDAMLQLLGPVANRIPEQCDELNDPKKYLLGLARRAGRDVRTDLCADTGAMASQDLGYNRRLCQLVEQHWSPVRAAGRSHRLRRACQRIAQLEKIASP